MKNKIGVEIHPVSKRSKKSIHIFIFMCLYTFINNVFVFVKKYKIGIPHPKKKYIYYLSQEKKFEIVNSVPIIKYQVPKKVQDFMFVFLKGVWGKTMKKKGEEKKSIIKKNKVIEKKKKKMENNGKKKIENVKKKKRKIGEKKGA
ncbi:hypothetical protein RFI_37936, partial [Reticulomyxa filosa]